LCKRMFRLKFQAFSKSFTETQVQLEDSSLEMR
jgi:hypothetical protein